MLYPVNTQEKKMTPVEYLDPVRSFIETFLKASCEKKRKIRAVKITHFISTPAVRTKMIIAIPSDGMIAT